MGKSHCGIPKTQRLGADRPWPLGDRILGYQIPLSQTENPGQDPQPRTEEPTRAVPQP